MNRMNCLYGNREPCTHTHTLKQIVNVNHGLMTSVWVRRVWLWLISKVTFDCWIEICMDHNIEFDARLANHFAQMIISLFWLLVRFCLFWLTPWAKRTSTPKSFRSLLLLLVSLFNFWSLLNVIPQPFKSLYAKLSAAAGAAVLLLLLAVCLC